MFDKMRAEALIFFLIMSLNVVGQQASIDEALMQEDGQGLASGPELVSKTVSIKVMDMRTMKSVPHFTIDFTSCGHPVYRSNQEGVFSMETTDGFSCYVRIGKLGYANLDLLIDHSTIDGDDKTFNVFLSRSANYFHGTLKDSMSQYLYLDKAKVELIAQDGQIQRAESNIRGEFSLYLEPNNTYQLTIRRPDYHVLRRTISTGEKVNPNTLKSILLQPARSVRQHNGLGSEIAVNQKSRSGTAAANYYSVQVLSKRAGSIKLNEYEDILGDFGELFIEEDGTIEKLKVGKFFDRKTAENTLAKVRSVKGFEDAFLSQYVASNDPANEQLVHAQNYMVRLATYQNPDLFESDKVEGLGKLKELQKGDWTVMLLEGFDSLTAARMAADKAHKVGFGAAYVVVLENDMLRKVSE